jgi:predicted 2-oxoglutarate/Fe(II)-dependent dioxygenase YbiX
MNDAIRERLLAKEPVVWTVPEVMTPAECAAVIERIDREAAPAPISTHLGAVMRPDVRNNDRVMFDDAPLAQRIFERVAKALPPRVLGRAPVGANERLRCYRYRVGQRFKPHFDAGFCRSDDEESELTLMVYLNDGFQGGKTHFLDLEQTIEPRAGMALLFFHVLLHEGCEVTAGTKYALRSDVMYRGPSRAP